MKRKIYSKLLDWKNRHADKYALLIDGARRVGKSWIAEEFAKNEYESYALIDFSKVGTGVKNIFNALDKFLKKYPEWLSEPFLLSDKDIRVEGGITYLPLYMACCL